jgi:polyhydroxybutyrate depolymerase
MVSRQLALLGLVGAFVVGCGGGGSLPGGTAGTSGNAGTTGSNAGTTGSQAGTTGSMAVTTGTTGSAGMTSAAGTTGAAGATGSTGTAGTTGAGGTVTTGATTDAGGRPSGPSLGCNMVPPNEPFGTAVNHTITITGMAQQYVAGYADRTYCSTMPMNYNPSKPYPLVIYGPGCGGLTCEGGPFSGRTDIFLVQATKAPKVYNGLVPPVPPAAAPGCFQTGVISTVDSPELNYFDQVVAEIESKYCIDKGRIFVAGSSSGGWFSNYLGCARGNVIRGIAPDSGGIPVDHPPCTGGAGVIEFPGDTAVKKDSMGREIGMALARDLFIKANGCSVTPTQMKFGNDTCDFYGNCDSPVVWCGGVSGGHQAGLNHLNPTGWAFWSSLK